jgi:hypothetical protein
MYDTIQQSIEKLHETFDSTDLDVEARKIAQKLEEARYNPGDIGPLADCVFSLLLAARNRGYNVEAVFDAVNQVAEKSLNATWKKMDDGTYQAF